MCAALTVGDPLNAQGETGFLRGKGHYDLVLSYSEDSYDEILPDGTDAVDVIRQAAHLYGAYGLTEELDISINATYLGSDLREFPGNAVEDDDERAWQDLILQAKWRVHVMRVGSGELSFLFAPGIKLPLEDYITSGLTGLGGNQIDLRGRIIAHYRPDHGRYYASFETGYDRRNGDPPDELVYHLQCGYNVLPWLVLQPFYSYVEARGNPVETPANSAGGGGGDPPGGGGGAVAQPLISPGGVDYERIGLQAFVRLSESWGFYANWRSTDDRRATGSIPGFSLGLVYSR